jgi:hypothetical protein
MIHMVDAKGVLRASKQHLVHIVLKACVKFAAVHMQIEEGGQNAIATTLYIQVGIWETALYTQHMLNQDSYTNVHVHAI